MFKIILRGGEVVEMTQLEFSQFQESYKNSTRGLADVYIGNGRQVTRNKIEEIVSGGTNDVDMIYDMLKYWYATFRKEIYHGVTNWLEYKSDPEERKAVELLLSERNGSTYVMKMIDYYNEFPESLKGYLKRPSSIYKHYDELAKHMVDNVMKKSNLSKSFLVNKFSV